jgi:tetratricopeptide (TPR) repeat protein
MNHEHWRHYARGWLFHFIGKTAPAYEAYAVAFQLDPQDIQSARHLAAIAAQRLDYPLAERWFLEVVRINPEDADTHYNLGFVREQMKAPRLAIDSFKEAVRLKPTLDRAWYGMGLAHASLGEHSEAATALREAARLQPMNGHAWYQLGMAYHHNGEAERVDKVVNKLLEFDPKITRQLIKDTGRNDLAHLLPEMPW